MMDVLSKYNWEPDPRWDNAVLNYDISKYPWDTWFLEVVKELKPSIDNLQNIHLHFKTTELLGLRKHLEKFTNSKEFCRKIDSFFEDYVSPMLGTDEYLVQSTCGIRIVVPNQEKLGRLLDYHTGYWTGYNNSMGTIWTPVTPVWDSNTMQVVTWEDTKILMDRIHKEKLSYAEIQKICIEKSFPANINVGQSWLFNQGHLHGNINNETGVSRLSFDTRWATGGFEYRRAGSFFRLRNTYAEIDKSKIKPGAWITYVDQNSDYIGHTPHFIVREFLLSFAKSLDITINEWTNGYWGMDWITRLDNWLNQPRISGIILASIHSLPCSHTEVIRFLKDAIKLEKQILFADEKILVTNLDDISNIEKLYYFQKQPTV